MFKAFMMGFTASAALLLGAFAAVLAGRRIVRAADEESADLDRHREVIARVNRMILAFGAGVLLCTLAFELMEDAYQKGGFDQVTTGFIFGALVFVIFDLWIDRLGSGMEMLLGALLDGLPESAVIGIGLVASKGLGLIMMIAVFISNFPEGFSGTLDMLTMKDESGNHRFDARRVLMMWTAVTLASACATLAGYTLLSQASESWIAFMLAAAAGSILAMVSHTMIPEAFHGVWEYTRRKRGTRFLIGDKLEAMAVVAGFLVAFFLSRITG